MSYNVLFLCCDDLAHVNRLLKLLVNGFDMPNLRRIANAGTEFDRGYCVVPVCEPARTAMMTGMSPADTKSFDLSIGWKQIVHPRNLWTYRLREAGYFMGTTGKVFHGYVPQPQWVYDALYDVPRFVHGPTNPPQETGVQMGGLYDYVFENEVDWYDVNRANDTINAIQNVLPDDRPWYWECGFHHPHLGWFSPIRIHNSISLDDIMLPESWEGGFDTLPFAREYIGNINLNTGEDPTTTDPSEWSPEVTLWVRQTIHNYAAACLWVDEQIGRVLDALEDSPFADNTIVTFYSDHGYHLSDHGRFHKFTLYEQAALAPMMIKVPGQTPRKVETPVSHIDLGATVLDLCDIPVPVGHRGVSLRPWIEGQTPADRAIPTFWYGSSSIAKGDKRLTVYQDGSAEMFNLVTDPWAKTNIADIDPDFATMREECITTANDWHMLIVEEGLDTSHHSNLQSFLGTPVTDARFSTSFVALGDLSSKGRSPSWQRMYSTNAGSSPDVKMPPHIEDFGLMGPKGAGNLSLKGNDLDNSVTLTGMFWKEFIFDLGEGDDEISVGDRVLVTAYGGPGNDILRAGQWQVSSLYGGTGNDTLLGVGFNDYLDGGPGDDSISGGGGNDTLISGPGADTMDSGAGDDLLINDAGSSVMTGGGGADTFQVRRTGETSYITDLSATDTLDLSDWAGIQPVSVVQDGVDVIVSAALERIVCQNADAAIVSAAITGATVA